MKESGINVCHIFFIFMINAKTYPSYLYCPTNIRALVQWHHPSGFNGTISSSQYGAFFPDLFNPGEVLISSK